MAEPDMVAWNVSHSQAVQPYRDLGEEEGEILRRRDRRDAIVLVGDDWSSSVGRSPRAYSSPQ